MILIPVLIGLYVIGMFGYYKMISRVLRAKDDHGVSDISLTVSVLVLTAMWPVALYWGLIKEAARDTRNA